MRRIDKLFEFINKKKMDGIIITSYSNIFYFSEFTSEDATLYLSKDNEAYLITDSRYTIQAKKQAKDFKIIITNGSHCNELAKLIKTNSNVFFEDSLEFGKYDYMSSVIDANFYSVNVDDLRNIKDEKEIKLMKKACDIASKGFYHILDFIKPGMKEIEVANELEYFMKSLGAEGLSFPTIVASGKRGAMPHGEASSKVIEEGDFVTMDFGCVYKGYCSDITRDYLIGENKKMTEIYKIVKEAQQRGVDAIKPGVACKEIDKVCRDYIESKGYGKYFTHSTGHGVGVVCHDPIRVSQLSETILEENMVITVEPGIYIPNVGGIRIEDDVLVTKDGHKVLTKATKKLCKINK